MYMKIRFTAGARFYFFPPIIPIVLDPVSNETDKAKEFNIFFFLQLLPG